MQLDIFDDSRDVMLRNDVLAALQQHDAAGTGQALVALQAEYPDHAALPALCQLLQALQATHLAGDGPLLADHAALAEAAAQLGGPVHAAAQQQLGHADARRWLQPLWQALARRASHLPFHPDRPADHAADLWLQAGDWAAAETATATIPAWRQQAAPLAWMAEAVARGQGLDAAWPLLVHLAWLSPGRFDAVTRRLSDPALQRLLKTFGSQFNGDGDVADLAWFPAWVLTDKPGLASLLDATPPALHSPPEQGLRLMLALLRLERQGRQADIAEHRRRLRGLHVGLFAAYMATRSAQPPGRPG